MISSDRCTADCIAVVSLRSTSYSLEIASNSAGPAIACTLSISPMPERTSCSERVLRKSTSMLTEVGARKVPTRFFVPAALIELFEPMHESACARRVVGMKDQLIPRNITVARNATISCVTPPPMAMSPSFFRTSSATSCSTKYGRRSRDFVSSLAKTKTVRASRRSTANRSR